MTMDKTGTSSYIKPELWREAGRCWRCSLVQPGTSSVATSNETGRHVPHGRIVDPTRPFAQAFRSASVRLGFVVASDDLFAPLAMLKQSIDLHSSRLSQLIVHDAITAHPGCGRPRLTLPTLDCHASVTI